MSDKEEKKSIVIDSAEKWITANQVNATFRFRRGDEIIEIPLKGISGKRYDEIERLTKDPIPPTKSKSKFKSAILQGKEDDDDVLDYKDPQYIHECDERLKLRQLLYIDAALTFDIPGDKPSEKQEWLDERIPGEVQNLYLFISSELLNLRALTDFTLGL